MDKLAATPKIVSAFASPHSPGYLLVEDYNNMIEHLRRILPQIFTIEGKNRALEVTNVSFDWPPDKFPDLKKQLDAKLKNLTYSTPIRLSFALKDKSGKILATAKDKPVMRIPLPTGRGTYIVDGREYAVRRQFRLKPGVYTTVGEDGVQAFLNTSTRQNVKMFFNPESNKFEMQVGTRTFPVYAVLKGLGVSDALIRKTWGDQLYNINSTMRMANLEDVIDRLYGTMYAYGDKGLSFGQKRDEILRAMEESNLDPWTTKITLGKSYESIGPSVLLDTTTKMLDVLAGRKEPDERDSVYFKAIYGIDDMVEFALKKYTKPVQRKLLSRLDDTTKDLNSVISRPVTTIGSAVRSRFSANDLAWTPDQYNPLDILSTINEVTLMGEGGIGSSHSIPVSTRDLHDSYLGFIDPIQTPTSDRIGANLYLAQGVKKRGKDLVTTVWDARKQKESTLSSTEIYDKVVALPGEYKFDVKTNRWRPKGSVIRAIYKGRIGQHKASEVDALFRRANDTYSFPASTIPFLGNTNPVRATFAVKQMGHVIPLLEPQVPLVESGVAGIRGGKGPILANKLIADLLSTRYPGKGPGVVEKVTKDEIWVKTKDGVVHKIDYYSDFPLNSDVSLSSRPIVEVGDKVEPGAVLAQDNFNIDNGLAMGTNLQIAYMPYKGLNFMDGLVISESAAKKLTSIHTAQEEYSKSKNDVFNRRTFISHYPNLYKTPQLDNLDEEGIIKPGTVVYRGDPLALKLTPRKLTEDDILRGNISSVFKAPLARDDKVWDRDVPGEVVRVVKNNDNIKVFVRSIQPAVVGDKLTGRAGQKGVIVGIIPDEEMPKTKNGNIIDIIQNPAAVPSRMNVGQVHETMAGKLADAFGQTYVTENFNDDVSIESLDKDLKANGLTANEPLYDKDGKEIGDIFVGKQYVYKLKQQASKYYQARGREDAYDIVSRRPIKGPALGPLGFYALLAHGVTANLKEMGGEKSELNDDWWRALETGHPLPAPKTTFAFAKLASLLQSAGININREKDSLRLLPLTDADVRSMSYGEVKDPALAVRIGRPGKSDFLQPMDGGLYDRRIFGGLMGDRWGHITLSERIPSPMFEKPVKAILGLTQSQYDGLVSGTLGVDEEGRIGPLRPNSDDTALTGGAAFEKLLGSIDRDAALAQAIETAKSARGDNRNAAYLKARYLNGLKLAGLQPKDYLMSLMPVLPPMFRPVYMAKRGDLRTSDLTALYQDIGRINNELRESEGLPESVTSKLRKDLYDAVKAFQGLGDPSNYSQSRGAIGVLKYLKGGIPAKGHFQDKIFSKRQTIGGRAVIMLDPKLPVDDVGIPEDMAWTMFKPFIIRKLTSAGINPLDAKKMTEDRHPMADSMLNAVMRERPVILSRDPKLHKFNYLAFNGRRVPGDAITIPPLVTKGFNADFDGDAMAVNVPVSAEAVQEARTRMMPSQNLIKYGKDTIIMRPEEDTLAGLYAGTLLKNNTGTKFPNDQAAVEAYHKGEIKLTDGIFVGTNNTTPGRILFNRALPPKFRDYSKAWSGRELTELLRKIALEDPSAYVPVVQAVKDLGEDYAYNLGLTFRPEDFYSVTGPELATILKRGSPTDKEMETIERRLKARSGDSILGLMADSGAKGKWSNIQQMLYSPLFVTGISGPISKGIKTGYAHGLDFEDYWTAIKGARTSLQASALEVREPGHFSKQLQRATMGMVVQPGDKEPLEGIEYDIMHPTVLNRYIAKDVVNPGGKVLVKAGEPITQELIEHLRKAGIKKINVRSPLTSEADYGLYAKDFGRLPGDKKPEVGMDAGIISAHTITEPAVQLTLRSFHGGGTGHIGAPKGLMEIWALLNNRTPAGFKAAMAARGGIVKQIKPLKTGGHEIVMDSGDVYMASPRLKLRVKVGDKVTKGMQLQDGYLQPDEILKYRGLRPLQMYLLEQIEENYGDSAPDRRYLETLVAALTRYSKITNPGTATGYLPGDVVPTTQLQRYNTQAQEEDDRVEFEPIFTGMDRFMHDIESDWLVQMLGTDMIAQIQRAAATGATSQLRGPKPIMPFVYNRTFGDDIDEGVY